MVLSLKVIPSPELSEVSRPVTEDEFGDELEAHMESMSETMYAHMGVGLSGVQVGDMRRILVADLGYVRTRTYGGDTIAMVNPEVVEQSEEEIKMSEGCLSYPGLEQHMVRPKSVVIKYRTPRGEEATESFSDYAARIILHEMDHFDGVTLYDSLSRLKRSRYNKELVKNLKKLGDMLKQKAGE